MSELYESLLEPAFKSLEGGGNGGGGGGTSLPEPELVGMLVF